MQEHGPVGRHPIAPMVDGLVASFEALRCAVRQAEHIGGTVDAALAPRFPAAVGGSGWGAIADHTDYAQIAAKSGPPPKGR